MRQTFVRHRLGEVASQATLQAEASHRQFYRVGNGTGGTWVVMYSPPDLERNDDFLKVARLFLAAGIRVPEVLDVDMARGFFLMTDLGSDHFADAYSRGETDRALNAGLMTLAAIQNINCQSSDIEPYTAARLEMELGIFTEWFLDRGLGMSAPAVFEPVRQLLVSNAVGQPQVCIHRDYHSRNLLLTPDGAVGVVDFQDALIGPYTYDLACLLLDCYHRFDDHVIQQWASTFRQQRYPQVSDAKFLKQLELTGLHRQLKAVGIFFRLALRDNKSSHTKHVMPVLAHARSITTRYEELSDFGAWLDAAMKQVEPRLATLTTPTTPATPATPTS